MTREDVQRVDDWLTDCDTRRRGRRDERERQKTVVAQAIRHAIETIERAGETDEAPASVQDEVIFELRDALQITVGVRR